MKYQYIVALKNKKQASLFLGIDTLETKFRHHGEKLYRSNCPKRHVFLLVQNCDLERNKTLKSDDDTEPFLVWNTLW